MLTLLVGLSVIKAALIIAYFMHLKFERFSLFLTLFPDADLLHPADADLPGRRHAHPDHEAPGMKRLLLSALLLGLSCCRRARSA